MPWAEGAPSELPDALKRSNDAARVPLPVPLIVTHRAWRLPPSGSTAGSALSPTPPPGGSDLKACIRRSSITPPLRGSRRSRADRRRLMRWGGQPIPATLPTSTSTQEGESQKPSRRRRLMRWGGQPIPASHPVRNTGQTKADAVGGTPGARHRTATGRRRVGPSLRDREEGASHLDVRRTPALPKRRWRRVVLPDCRGPVRTTAGNSEAAFSMTGSSERSM